MCIRDRSDLGFVGVDDDVERGRVDQAFLDQHRLQRAHPQRDLGQVRMLGVIVVVVVVVIVRHGGRLGGRSAVSYTHLDVYKRQRWCAGGIPKRA